MIRIEIYHVITTTIIYEKIDLKHIILFLLNNKNLKIIKLRVIINNLFKRKVSKRKLKIHFLKKMKHISSTSININEMFITASRNKSFKNDDLFSSLLKKINNGCSLSIALEIFPELFDDFFRKIIEIGEVTNTLDQSFDLLLDQHIEKENIRNKIIQTTRYPTFLLLCSFVVMIFINKFVLPQIENLFSAFSLETSSGQKIMFHFLQAILKSGSIIFLVLIVILFLLYIISKVIPNLKTLLVSLKGKIPIYKTLIDLKFQSSILYMIGILIKNNISLKKSIIICQQSIMNDSHKNKLSSIVKSIDSGSSFSLSVNEAKLFEDETNIMISLVDKSPKLSNVLISRSIELSTHLHEKINFYLTLLPPILLIILSALIGSALISIYIPLLSLSNTI